MRIAVTFDKGLVFPHFGHTEQLKFYDVVDNAITKTVVVPTQKNGPGSLLNLLRASHVDLLFCGGIGCGPRRALSQLGIACCGGVSGDADDVVRAYLAGEFTIPTHACAHRAEKGGKSCGCSKAGHGCSGSCKKHAR